MLGRTKESVTGVFIKVKFFS